MQNGMVTEGKSLTISYRSTQKPVHVYSRFIHNYPKLETTKQPTTGCINKLWDTHIIIMEYYSAIKRNELKTHIQHY